MIFFKIRQSQTAKPGRQGGGLSIPYYSEYASNLKMTICLSNSGGRTFDVRPAWVQRTSRGAWECALYP